MTWTYSGNPAASAVDAVRYLVGDTDAADPLATDEEIGFALAQNTALFFQAGMVARAIAARFTRRADTSSDGLSISLSQKASQYLTLAEKLESQAAGAGVMPYFGGTSYADKRNTVANTDRIPSAFASGMERNDNPDTDSLIGYWP
jgi:hypothetical protein